MNNNPFLTSNKVQNKQNNNRFQFLDKELDITQIKKEKKIVSKYDSTDNSFTKSFTRRDDTRRDDSRRDDRRNFNNNFKENRPKKQPIKKAEFDLANEYFPDLVSTNADSSNTILQQNSNFKDILNTRNQPEIQPFQEHIEPGWVKLSRTSSNNKIIRKYGLPTEYEINLKKQADLEHDLHYCMTRGIEKMKRGWEKYKDRYDDFNGEGAYDEKYKLPSIYDSEYEIEDESDDDTESYSINE